MNITGIGNIDITMKRNSNPNTRNKDMTIKYLIQYGTKVPLRDSITIISYD